MNNFMVLEDRPKMNKSIVLLLWIIINVGVWAAWLVFATNPVFVRLQSSEFLSYAGLVLVGVGMGILQGLLLRQQFSIACWTFLTTIGFTIGFISSLLAAFRDNNNSLLGGALLGLAIGVFQSVCWLPRFGRVALWIVANILGWSLGMFLPQLIAFQSGSAGTPWLSNLFPVVFSAVITGVVLVWLKGQPNWN